MTITVFADSEAALDTEVARIRGIAHQNGMRLVREVTALEAAFFSMHPGNMDYRARDMTVSSSTSPIWRLCMPRHRHREGAAPLGNADHRVPDPARLAAPVQLP
jgi:type IV secretory pathway VirB4 component